MVALFPCSGALACLREVLERPMVLSSWHLGQLGADICQLLNELVSVRRSAVQFRHDQLSCCMHEQAPYKQALLALLVFGRLHVPDCMEGMPAEQPAKISWCELAHCAVSVSCRMLLGDAAVLLHSRAQGCTDSAERGSSGVRGAWSGEGGCCTCCWQKQWPSGLLRLQHAQHTARAASAATRCRASWCCRRHRDRHQ